MKEMLMSILIVIVVFCLIVRYEDVIMPVLDRFFDWLVPLLRTGRINK